MQPKHAQSDEHPILGLVRWLDTPAGRYAQAWEQRQFASCVEDAFGYRSVQLGLPELDTLASNRMPLKLIAGDLLPESCHAWQGMVRCAPEELPFESQGLDLITLPHTLEFADDPHEVLREVERVLIPEGQVLITGLNPWSLWGWHQRRAQRRALGPELWPVQSIAPHRLRDWLHLLGFEVQVQRFAGWTPNWTSERWVQRMAWMDTLGQRWCPIVGGVYLLLATKRVPGGHLLPGKAWRKVPSRAALAAPAARWPDAARSAPDPESRS